eukprot:3813214-Rhodomonas_salina.1
MLSHTARDPNVVCVRLFGSRPVLGACNEQAHRQDPRRQRLESFPRTLLQRSRPSPRPDKSPRPRHHRHAELRSDPQAGSHCRRRVAGSRPVGHARAVDAAARAPLHALCSAPQGAHGQRVRGLHQGQHPLRGRALHPTPRRRHPLPRVQRPGRRPPGCRTARFRLGRARGHADAVRIRPGAVSFSFSLVFRFTFSRDLSRCYFSFCFLSASGRD